MIQQLSYTAQFCGEREEAWLPSQGGGVAGAHHAERGYQRRKRKKECAVVQCERETNVSGDDHHSVRASIHA
jgi:hypothetical protein